MRSYVTFAEVQDGERLPDSFTADELELLEMQADAVLEELLAWESGE